MPHTDHQVFLGPGRPRRRLGALLVTIAVAVAVAAGAGVAAASPAPAAGGTPYLYVANVDDGTVSAYDIATGAITATIPVGGSPQDIAVSPDGRTAYVADNGSDGIWVIDTPTNTVTAAIRDYDGPEDVAVSPDGRTAYVTNDTNSIWVISTATNTVTATIPVGGGPEDVAVSPDGRTVYTADRVDSTVSVISTVTGKVTATIPVSAGWLAVSPDGRTVYTANTWGSSTVSVISTATNKITATIPVGDGPDELAVSPDGRTVYVTDGVDGTVSVISTATSKVTATIPDGVRSEPWDVAVSPDSSTVYVANALANTVSVISSATDKVTATIPVGASPWGVATTSVPPAVPPAVTSVSPDNGPQAGGTTVTITGTGLTGTTSVDFGAAPAASFTVNSGTQVTAVSPPQPAGIVDVTVTTLEGTSAARAADQYTFNRIPQAISFAPPAAGTAGRHATLTAAGGGSGNPVVFTVDPSSGAGVCQVAGANGSTVRYLAGGICVIEATQAGNAAYAPAVPVFGVITVSQAPAFVKDTPPLTAVAGRPYGYAFRATGTPAPSYALAPGAPAWLTINPATGQLAGRPPAGTTAFSYTVTTANTAGTAAAGRFSVAVTDAADLSASLSCTAVMTTQTAGTCTLTVTNAGPASAAGVTAAIQVPSLLTLIPCSPDDCVQLGNTVTWLPVSLASGASAQFQLFGFEVDSPGNVTLVGTVSARSPDPNLSNNASAARVIIMGG